MTNSTNTTRRRWWLPAIGLAVGLAGGAHLLSVAIRGDAQPGATRPVVASPVRSVVAFGMVDVEDGICKMWATVPGAVVSDVLVKQGDIVQAGAVLLRLDDTLARKKLEEAAAAVDVAKAARDRGKSLPDQHRLELEQCEAAVKVAEAQRNVAQQDVEKAQHFSGIDQGSRGALRISEEQLRAADQALLSRKAELAKLKLLDPKAEMQGLEAQVKQAVAARDGAEAALSQYTLVAKKAGVVLTVTAGVGDTIVGPTPNPTIQLCPAGPRVIRADVEQACASLVAVGQRVTVEDDTHAVGKWTGHIQSVADWYTNQRPILSDPTQYSDVRTMPCVIELDPDQPPLKINQRVLVTIEVPIK